MIQHIYVLPAKKISTFRVSSLSDVSISIGTVASQVFLSDHQCPVALILQIILNLAFDDDTQTRMKMRELTLREKQAIWMLKEKRKSIRAIAKTKGMEKSRVWKPPATNNYLIG